MAIFSLVVPVFNEEETLPYTIKRLSEVLNATAYHRFSQVQIVFVNDGSRDRTAELLNQYQKEFESKRLSITPIHFSRNFGHSNAVLAGLTEAHGDVIGIIDADLQDPPEIMEHMIAKLTEGFDVVYGLRAERKNESFFKRFTAWAFYRMLNMVTGVPIPKDTGDFRVMNREVLEALLACQEHEPFLRGLVAWLGFRQSPFPYVRDERRFGSTKYPFRKMLRFAVHAILSFSIKPLRFAIYLAFAVLLGFFAIGAWALVVHLQGKSVPGWTSIVLAFMAGQSIILAVLGVVGLYIGQIHVGVQGRPRYIKMRPAREREVGFRQSL